jgi:hypothetical protein
MAMACRRQSRVQPVAGEVNRNEPHRSRQRPEISDPATLIPFGSRMVDLEHIDGGQFRHPPSPVVQASTHDHQLRQQPGPDSVVDCHRTRHDDLGAGPHHLELDPLAPALGRDALTHPPHSDTLVVTQQRHRDRVSEPALGDAPMRSRATLAHQDGGTAGPACVHCPVLSGAQ